MNTTDKPIYWVQYALTGATWTPCIANGNTRAESRVDFSPEQIQWFKESQARVVTNAKDFDYKFTWSKYRDTANLSTTQIAKLVRSELRAKFPQKKWYKFSVRTDYFAWGSSIDVDIVAVPFKILTDEHIEAVKNNENLSYRNIKRFTPEAEELERASKAILNQYNFDDSDSQTDYFHVNYYWHVQYAYALTRVI